MEITGLALKKMKGYNAIPNETWVTATDGDKDRPQNIVYFLTGQGIDPDNPANSKFDINRTTGGDIRAEECVVKTG
ncbi:hypothetical protein NQ318_009748 [Aromia moschata]|uniref:Uncharacterized protein n=1 Tax=Aromia moschata TaxID=1265417 RepID=A0AAV8Y7T1_9CUCU|nr:hypothetical protein NQ318_009748 [Aromia moschata]